MRWALQLEQNIAHNFFKAQVEHYYTLSLSHKSSVGVFNNQTVDIVLPDFKMTSNILEYKAVDLIHWSQVVLLNKEGSRRTYES